MPSTRKQKAEDKRLSQSDVRPDIENVDVTLGFVSNIEFDEQEGENEIGIDQGSRGLQRNTNEREDFRSLLITNLSENSGVTV